MAQRAIGSPVNIYVRLHGELNVLVRTVQVVREAPLPVWTVWTDEESVVHVTEPAEGLVSSPVEHHLLEVLHVESGDDRR
jgi:hypothetical protein